MLPHEILAAEDLEAYKEKRATRAGAFAESYARDPDRWTREVEEVKAARRQRKALHDNEHGNGIIEYEMPKDGVVPGEHITQTDDELQGATDTATRD